MKDDVVLVAKDLSVGYRKGKNSVQILEGLNFSLKDRKLTCLMGPNGIGKSTLIRTLCKAQRPLGGNVKIVDKDLSRFTSQEFASQVSVVLTDNVNVGNLTVKELVAFGRYPYTNWNISFTTEDKESIEKAIDQSGLRRITHKRIFELSDGQRQKVMIARALCQETPIIILDEPTAHLDLNNRVEVINLLKELATDAGKAILMATHELDLALQTADELWLVGASKKLITGFPEDLVLNGQIDEVFKLKGFDLKTGHLEKKVIKGSLNVVGEGYLYLWTKNALERNGFGVSAEAHKTIKVVQLEEHVLWENEKGVQFDSLENVIKSLQ